MPPLLAQLEFPDGIDWKAPQENTGAEQNRRTKEGKEGEREPREGGGTCINIRAGEESPE